MSVHHIHLTQVALIGSFTKEVPSLLTISSGDTIRFQTLDAGWGTGPRSIARDDDIVCEINGKDYALEL
ncbi:hypothetical protein PACILC2_36670 [Paenibacillus cisolokensis]|uniref:PDZ domain-containing protein n=1 Tax=Paenibacillus cisolokensis TaxID=1658519 RepID=A0ABQ4NA40_9BACL|nr:hypothetical protein [Paenibacillus cisolokensis]GIQ65099.1 hypothetical protein PACILC2_36670 [Paenibacillus cisolokensis]